MRTRRQAGADRVSPALVFSFRLHEVGYRQVGRRAQVEAAAGQEADGHEQHDGAEGDGDRDHQRLRRKHGQRQHQTKNHTQTLVSITRRKHNGKILA